MTAQEIKETYSMRDILHRYGLEPNRSGFIRCPFHVEDTPSMKIYKDSFYCFGGCGAHGDIFTFVMKMENCSFKDAFMALGGTYDHPESRSEQIARQKKILILQQERDRKLRQREKKKKRIRELAGEMHGFRVLLSAWKVFSPQWCNCMKNYLAAQFECEMLDDELNDDGR